MESRNKPIFKTISKTIIQNNMQIGVVPWPTGHQLEPTPRIIVKTINNTIIDTSIKAIIRAVVKA